jgi:hypothetical protein
VVDSDVALHVTTPATRRLAVGESVNLTVDPAPCIALPGDEERR